MSSIPSTTPGVSCRFGSDDRRHCTRALRDQITKLCVRLGALEKDFLVYYDRWTVSLSRQTAPPSSPHGDRLCLRLRLGMALWVGHSASRSAYAFVMTDGKRVVVEARLKGMDRNVPCKVAGLQTSAPGAAVFEIRNISIVDVPKNLPDGMYEVEYVGSGERVRKTGNTWTLV